MLPKGAALCLVDFFKMGRSCARGEKSNGLSLVSLCDDVDFGLRRAVGPSAPPRPLWQLAVSLESGSGAVA